MTSASKAPAKPKPRTSPKGATGVHLDPSDPGDARIIARQVETARQSGRDGLDRAGSTRGREDLEAAYDEGAAEGAAPAAAAEGKPKGKGGSRPWPKVGSSKTGPGWGSLRPRSPARVPTRAADAGGFLTGLALYTVVVIYIRYGPEGWKGWLSAKFLNKPMASGNQSSDGKPKKRNGGTAAV